MTDIQKETLAKLLLFIHKRGIYVATRQMTGDDSLLMRMAGEGITQDHTLLDVYPDGEIVVVRTEGETRSAAEFTVDQLEDVWRALTGRPVEVNAPGCSWKP